MSTTSRSEGKGRREINPARSTQRFPEDLRAWLRGPVLVRLAHVVAQEQTVSMLRPVFSLSATRFHHPWRMLALLTYAYAGGIWQSRAIAELARLDPYLFELCHGQPPAVELIRRFRVHNGVSIVRCLEQLLRRLWCQRQATRGTALSPVLTAEIICEARLRLQRAEQSDLQGPEEARVQAH